jgi:hypothetical protein
LEGALIGLQRIRDDFKNIPLRVSAVAGQIEEGLRILRAEAKKAKRRGDKIRFAEAIIAALDPKGSGRSDRNVWHVCWRAIEMLTKRENPSQAELRRAVDEIDGLPFSDQEWKRLIKRTGLNRELLTHRQKTQGIKIRR